MRQLGTICGVAVVLFALGMPAAQCEQLKIEQSLPQNDYLTPEKYPCLTETIHVTGTLEVREHYVVNPGGGYSWQYRQSTKGMTAVGLTTGAEYRYNGPLSVAQHGTTDEPWVTWYPLESTLHNINHYVGPGSLPDVFVRQLIHMTLDRETGEVKVVIDRTDVTCK